MAAKTTVKVAVINNAAKDDYFQDLDWLVEDGLKGDGCISGTLGVLGNDPGSAKIIGWSDRLPTTQAELTGKSALMDGKLIVSINPLNGELDIDASGLNAELQSLGAGEERQFVFYYTVQMANGAYSTAQVTFFVEGVNDAATFGGDFTGEVYEDDDASAEGIVTVSDVDNGQSGFKAADAADLAGAYGNFTFDPASGKWTFTIDNDAAQHLGAGVEATETLTVTSLDGTTKTITVTVHGKNDDAQFGGDTAGEVYEDGNGSAGGTLTVSDLDTGQTGFNAVNGDALIGSYGDFAFDAATGQWTYTLRNDDAQSLGADETAVETLTVTSLDGTQQTITVTIHGENDAPVVTGAIADHNSAEDQPVFYQVPADAFSDVDGDALTYSATLAGGDPLPSWLVFNAATRTFSGTPPQDYNGTLSLTVTASDGSLSASDTFDLIIDPVNDAPVATGGDASGDEDSVITGQVDGTDVENSALTYSLVAPVAGLVLNADGSYSYTPAANFNGTVTFDYRAYDGELYSDPVTVTITVNAVNDAPVATGGDTSGDEDSVITGQVDGTDVENSALTYSLVAPVAGLVLNADGSYSYTPAANFNGTVTFDYRAYDGELYSDPVTVTITVNAVNDAPVATGGDTSGDEDSVITGQVDGTDVENSALTYSLVAPVAGLVLNADGSYSYTPAANFNGTVTFDYRAYDGELYSDPVTVTITVNAVNDAPVATGGDTSGDEDSVITGQVGGTDVENSALTYSLVAPVAGLVLNADGSYSYTPAANFNGTVTFDYRAYDGELYSDPVTVTITVNAVNDAPVAQDGTNSGDEDGGAIIGSVVASDIDSESLTYALVSGPAAAQGVLTLNGDGTYSFVPAADYFGTVTFTYRANDGSDSDNLSNVATVTIEVTPVNDAPVVAGPVTLAASDEDAVRIITAADLLGNASDIDSADLSILNLTASSGTLTDLGNGSWSFQPAANDDTSVTFTYQVSDGALTADASATLDLLAVNDAPVVTALSGGVGEDGPTFSSNLLAGATDVENDALSVLYTGTSITTSGGRTLLLGTHYTVSGATFVITPAGFALFNSLPGGAQDTIVLNYSVTDGAAATPNTLTVVVDGANEINLADPHDYDDGVPPPQLNVGSTVVGTAGDDNLVGTVNGSGNEEAIFGRAGSDTIRGGSGTDYIFGGSGDDTIYGDSHTDKLFGGSGNDRIFGGSQSDLIIGGLGDDILTGDGDKDIFAFRSGFGNDRITDFEAGDTINIFGVVGLGSFSDIQGRASQVGTSVFITDGNGNSITIDNMTVAQLNSSMFTFTDLPFFG